MSKKFKEEYQFSPLFNPLIDQDKEEILDLLSYENSFENKISIGNNYSIQNEENSIRKSFNKSSQEAYNPQNLSLLGNNMKFDDDWKFKILPKDTQNDNFIIENSAYNVSNIDENENEENNRNFEPNPNQNIPNQNITITKKDEKMPSTLFTTFRIKKKKIECKKEGAKKKIKSYIIKCGVKKLNKLKKNLPKIFQKRECTIHVANSKLFSQKVSKADDKKFWNKTFKYILSYGRNRMAKKQLNNFINIKNIIKYINDYYKKYHKLSVGLRKIKNLIYMKFLGLIKNFVKSKEFETFKKKEESIIFRNGIMKEKESIDIFTEKGIIDLFRPEDNLTKNGNQLKKKKFYRAYRKYFHIYH